MSSAKVSRHKERAELSDAERESDSSRLRRKRKAAGSRSPESEDERKRHDNHKTNEGGGKSKGYGKDDDERRKNKENDKRGAWGNSRERYGDTYYDRDYFDEREFDRYGERGGHREYRGGRYWEKDRDNYEHRRDRDGYEDRVRQKRDREADLEGAAPYRRDDGERNKRERDRNRSKREDGDDRRVNRQAGGRGETQEDNHKNQDRNDKIARRNDSGEGGEPRGDESRAVAPPPPPAKKTDMLTSKTGGAYIPPAKLRMMQAQITDKSSVAYQRIAWEALKKSIHGHINKVNVGNLKTIVRDLLKENVVRGRGLLCRSIIQAQAASPTFTHVYAGLVSVINSKFPNIGELLMKRIVLQFRRGFKRNDKSTCISAVTFIAHLVNQRVAHEIIALEILTLLVESPTDDSIEVSIAFLKECGMKLLELSNKGMLAIFEMLRNILHEGKLEKRVQYMIEVIFQIRKGNFQGHEAVIADLDLVEEEDQFTHIITLDEVKDGEEILNVFKFDAEYEANEEKYNTLKKEILDESSDESGSESGSDADEEESNADSGDDENKEAMIVDNTETNLVALRRAIYLTIHSSLDFEECAHKLMRMQLKPGQEIELCHMFLDCCAEQRTYEKFFGLLAQRFCQINKVYVPPFQQIFRDTYNTIHRLDTNKLRNVAKFFAHLLFTDAISWEVLSFIRLNEEDTTSSSRIFIKILFQELSEYMSLGKLNDRVKDPTMQTAFEGLFPRDNPKNTRFAINFFTSIGLGGLTDELREHLKTQPKAPLLPSLIENLSSGDSDSSSSESSSDSSSSDSSSDSDDGAHPSKSDRKKRKSSSSSSRRPKKTGGGSTSKKKKKKSSHEQQHKKKRKQKSGR